MKSIEVAAAAAAVFMLCACGGGGGGGGTIIREVAFTSVSAIGPNQRVVMDGVSLHADAIVAGTTVTSFNINAPHESNSSMRLTYDGNRNLSGIAFATPEASVSFAGNEINCTTPGACSGTKANGSALGVVIDPVFYGWNYQSFGIWAQDTSPTGFRAGTISAGAASPVSALPLSTGTFMGHASGFFVDRNGVFGVTDADMTAIANFGAGTINFATTNTTFFGSTTLPNGAPASGLDLTGTLTYGPGNRFSGTVDAVRPIDGSNPQITGTATGRFYGPNAEEMGGVFGLGSTIGERYLGAFGGRR
jgi:hypothetical protein